MRPQSIVMFERLYLGAILVGIVNTVIGWHQSLALLQAQPIPLGPGFLYFTTAIGILIPLLLWYFIARQGSVVAKWVLVALFVLGLLGYVLALSRGTVFAGVSTILGVIALLMQASAIWMLFRPDAEAWLSGTDSGSRDV